MPENGEPEDGHIIDFVGLSRSVIDSPDPIAVSKESTSAPTWPVERDAADDSAAPPKESMRAEPRRPDRRVPPPADIGDDGIQDASRARAASDDDIRIGLWGAPRAGKTTYLNALNIAAQKPVMGYDWTISGCDEPSVEFLRGGVKRFVRDKKFPVATKAYQTYAWRFEGTRHRAARGRLGRRMAKLFSEAHVDSEFIVELQDVSGEAYGEVMWEQYEAVQNHLLNSQGIVYIFDPVGNEEERTNSFDFYYETIDRLKTRMRERGRLVGGRLPHYVSVCVTKFDHPQVFEAAMAAGHIYQADDGAMPEVPSKITAEFLRDLCRDDGTKYVCDSLENDFLRGRVEYFTTSSVGFHLTRGHFDRQDFTNASGDGFRAAAHPINVLEPIISLARRIRNEAGVV